jgi:hypothetical protein
MGTPLRAAGLPLAIQGNAGELMGRAEDYRRYAAECLALAQRVRDPNDRGKLLDMASAFNRLAARAEDNSDSDSDQTKT